MRWRGHFPYTRVSPFTLDDVGVTARVPPRIGMRFNQEATMTCMPSTLQTLKFPSY